MSHCKDCGFAFITTWTRVTNTIWKNNIFNIPYFLCLILSTSQTPPVIEEIPRFPSWYNGFRQILRMWLNMGCPRDQRSLRPLPYDYDEDEKRPWSPGGFTQIWFMVGFNFKTRELLHRLVRYVSKPKSCVNVNRSWRVQCLKCWHVTIAALFFSILSFEIPFHLHLSYLIRFFLAFYFISRCSCRVENPQSTINHPWRANQKNASLGRSWLTGWWDRIWKTL